MRILLLMLTLVMAQPVWAGDAYHAQIKADFIEAMNDLQGAIDAQGYKVLRVLPVDMGLSNVGYAEKPYRVVFFAKDDLQERLRETPELTVYLPLSITAYEDKDVTHFLAVSPMEFAARDASPTLLKELKGWDSDMQAIFARLK